MYLGMYNSNRKIQKIDYYMGGLDHGVYVLL